MHNGLVANAHLAQASDKQIRIILTQENIAALIPATHDVVSRPLIFNS